jgi:hypothetical protein
MSSGASPAESYITLQLEENITIDAGSGTDSFFHGTNMASIVEVTDTCTFVLEAGAKLTNGYGVYPVFIRWYGRFEMNGGEISNCKRRVCSVYIPGDGSGHKGPGTFIYRDGVFRDNDGGGLVYAEGSDGGYRLYYEYGE